METVVSVPHTLLSLDQMLASEQRLIVLDFCAEWCGPCKRISPEISKLQSTYFDRVVVQKIDVDQCDDVASHYKITSMPTFLFIKNNTVLDTVIGANLELIHEKIAVYI
jgi:thioredoxin 1